MSLVAALTNPPMLPVVQPKLDDIVSIPALQGDGSMSPYSTQRVSTYGAVTAIAPNGFFLQDPVGDGRDETSDGIFAYTVGRPAVAVGDCVIVSGAYVDEFYDKTELSRIKRIEPSDLCSTATMRPVMYPEPQVDQSPAATYEAMEGMLVEMTGFSGVVQGPTKRFDSGDVEIALMPERLAPYLIDGRVHQADGREMDMLIYLSGVLGTPLPDAGFGDRVIVGSPGVVTETVRAVIDYNFGKYQLMLLPGTPVTLQPVERPHDRALPAQADEYTVCSFNLQGLGRGVEQFPEAADYAAELERRALAISRPMAGCTIIALQETGTPEDAEALAAKLAQDHGLDYVVSALAGPQTWSDDFPLTVSLLALRDRATILDAFSPQACTAVDHDVRDTLATCPPGFVPIVRPQTTGGGSACLRRLGRSCMRCALSTIIGRARVGMSVLTCRDDWSRPLLLPALAQDALDRDPLANVVVLGDLNDYFSSEPVEIAASAPEPDLVNVFDFVPELDRYTYIYNGGSQALDHMSDQSWSDV